MIAKHVPLIEESFYNFSTNWALLAAGSRTSVAGFDVVHTGYRLGMNRVLIDSGSALWSLDSYEVENRVELLQQELERIPGSYVLFLRTDLHSKTLIAALRKHRFFHDTRQDWASMSLCIEATRRLEIPKQLKELTVTRVVYPDDVLSWIDVVCDGFELAQTARRTMFAQLVEKYLANRDHGTTLLLASHCGDLAGALALHETKEAAGVFWVTTLPQKRRLGVARCLMEESIRTAALAKKKALVLQATPAGKCVYGSLGFEEAFTYQLYLYKTRSK